MTTRSQWHEIELPATPVAVFNLLLNPKAIRGRWGSVSAIATELDGLWVIAWGERENDPNYVVGAKIRAFESPRRVALTYEYCRAKTGQLAYGSAMAAEFTIQKTQVGALLRVTHTGIPTDAQAYFDSAAEGWRAMLQGIATLLAPKPR